MFVQNSADEITRIKPIIKELYLRKNQNFEILI